MAGVDDHDELELTDTDKMSSTWKRIAAHLEAKRDLLRRRNDAELDQIQTTRLRAQLALIKELLAAGESRD